MMNIKRILEDHKLWLAAGNSGKRADLIGANLRSADLCRANLCRANLRGANLSGANLSGANLSGAYLRSADLRRANLSGANLSGANLTCANLSGANLSGANLDGTDLSDAVLNDADLTGIITADGYTLTGDYHQITNVGSENGVLELYQCEHTWYVKRGCFEGSKEQFLAAVEKTHGDNEHAVKYRAIINALT